MPVVSDLEWPWVNNRLLPSSSLFPASYGLMYCCWSLGGDWECERRELGEG
jgi:hypothetical protein